MKEAMGGISLFQIVIVFVLLFTGIMCLTINYSRAYGVKDEVINILQKKVNTNGVINADTVKEIATHLQETGYMITGSCPSGFTGYDRNGNESSNAAFCIKENDVTDLYMADARSRCAVAGCTVAPDNDLAMHYYDIALFYQLDIPGLIGALNFKLYGSTKIIFGEV